MAGRQGALESVGVKAEFAKSFSGRRTFVTGHTGFKGSWLALWLHELGARVAGFGLRAPTSPSNYEASCVRDALEAEFEGDIRNEAALSAALKKSEPEIIFHLAAQPLVRRSYAAPHETFEVNVGGTSLLLNTVRALKLRCAIVVVTTDKCYENREQVWGYRENDPMGGFDPYSASKGAAELVVAAYRNSFFNPRTVQQHGVKLASARAGNVIGGGDWAADRIVTDMVSALAAGKPVPVRNPRAVRPWQHVLEPLSGYLSLAARMLESDDPRWCGAWNFGPAAGDEAPVGELAGEFCRAWGKGTWNDCSDPAAPHEAHTLRLSIDKALWELGWRPRWNRTEAIARTAGWYRRFHADPGQSMHGACLEHIEQYCKRRHE